MTFSCPSWTWERMVPIPSSLESVSKTNSLGLWMHQDLSLAQHLFQVLECLLLFLVPLERSNLFCQLDNSADRYWMKINSDLYDSQGQTARWMARLAAFDFEIRTGQGNSTQMQTACPDNLCSSVHSVTSIIQELMKPSGERKWIWPWLDSST